jgi:hypothetical protein
VAISPVREREVRRARHLSLPKGSIVYVFLTNDFHLAAKTISFAGCR